MLPVIEARIGRVLRDPSGERDIFVQAVGDRSDNARTADAENARRCARGAIDVDQGNADLFRAEAVGELAGVELSAADIDPSYLFAPLAARAVKHQPDHVQAKGERNAQKLVVAAHRLSLRTTQHLVDIKLDLIAQRQ